ncbi:membrane protein [Caballeronia arationis]|uniref:hypothetical protein n=1 Tax=Caballeronia arationis TaxID=1777142 RepID=UPI00074C4A18|nr:hypothetical protein [Caballeronia arationis]SAL02663.1 membrane protein [Caballeronia arationis]
MYNWTSMAGYGLGHWIFYAVMVLVLLYPLGRILTRIGLSPFWSILALVPILNLIGLWLLAFIDWPDRRSKTFG